VDMAESLSLNPGFRRRIVPTRLPGGQRGPLREAEAATEYVDVDDDGDGDVDDFLTFSTRFNGSLNISSPARLPPVPVNCAL